MFDPRSSSLVVVDPVRISVDSHESCEPLNSSSSSSSSSFVDDGELQFRRSDHKNIKGVDEDDESGSSSPTLWNRSNIDLHSSRAQAIARGQREMMEIVKNMPESSYELSLKDLVEYHNPIRLDNDNDNDDDDDDDDASCANQEQSLIKQEERVMKKKVTRRQGSVKAKVMRSGSVDNSRGLLLKMVFPLTWIQPKRKSTDSSPRSSTISTKQLNSTKSTNGDDVMDKSLRGRRNNTNDKDWWVRRFSSESSSNGTNSSSSGSSTSSGSIITHQNIRTRRRSGLLNSYCSCFPSRKEKSTEFDNS